MHTGGQRAYPYLFYQHFLRRKIMITLRKFNLALLLISLISICFSGCSMQAPDAGHEVVLIQKPLLFGHGGVVADPVKTGLTYTAITTDGVDVNMQPMMAGAELPDTMTSDGVPITFHAVMNIQVTDSVDLIKNFGPNWYVNNIDEQFKQMVRQAVRKRGMNETAIDTTAIDAIDAEIRDNLVTYFQTKKLPIKLITMTVGKANPPDSIKNQRIETAAQQQRIQTEIQTKLAEDQRKMAEQSRAAADNAYREAMHLSPEQFIQLENIKMLKTIGTESKGTNTFLVGGSVSPVYNVK
jgi:regulator of protease activity HflC (stomatin/prohibitin superfamily)